jgi:hypothetical protein
VVVETLPWFLPARWALAVGVTQGESWGVREQRWRLSDSQAAGSFDDGTWALLDRYERQGGVLRPSEDEGVGQPDVPLEVDFAGELALLGHSSLPQAVVVGGDLPLQDHWQAQQPLGLDYSVFLHLRDETDHTVAQWDGQPTWYGVQPTTRWLPGETVRSAHTLHIDEDLAPGQYRLVMGVYDWRSASRLPILDQDSKPVSNELELGTVRVEAAQRATAPSDLCCAVVPECCVSLEQD